MLRRCHITEKSLFSKKQKKLNIRVLPHIEPACLLNILSQVMSCYELTFIHVE